MKRFIRVISTSGVVALALAAIPVAATAGGHHESDESTNTAETDRGHGKRQIMMRALEDVDLRPEQKKEIGKLESDAEERRAPVKAAKREFVLALADQVEKGKIDRCEMAPKVKALSAKMADAKPGDREAFERLHQILDPEQRGEFVDALKKHWEEHKKAHESGAMVDKLAETLDLSSAQKDRVKHIVAGLKEIRDADPARAERRERWSKILEAFKGDQFEMDEVAPMRDAAGKSAKKIDGALWAAEAVLPALTKEQRTLGAQKMRDHVNERTAHDERQMGGEEPSSDDD